MKFSLKRMKFSLERMKFSLNREWKSLSIENEILCSENDILSWKNVILSWEDEFLSYRNENLFQENDIVTINQLFFVWYCISLRISTINMSDRYSLLIGLHFPKGTKSLYSKRKSSMLKSNFLLVRYYRSLPES